MEENLMEKQKEMERELDLKDLFWNILLSWRQMIIFGIVFAVLFTGLKFIKDKKAYQVAMNVENGQEEIGLTPEEKDQISSAKEIIKRLEEYQEYLDTSVLMQINPYEKQVIELQYYVKSDYTFNYTQDTQNDYTSDLVMMYYNYIVSGEMSKNVIKNIELPVEQEDISELWTVAQVGKSISIKIAYPEEDKLEEISKFIKSKLKEKESEFQKIGSHELQLYGESKNVIVDNSLSDRKYLISNNIASLNTQLKNLKLNMTEYQLEILDDDIEDTLGNEKNSANIDAPSMSKKYFLLGAFIGIFLVCIWIACKMLFTSRLQSSEEIRTLYNTRLLGELNVQFPKRGFLSIIDEQLLKIRNRKKKKLTVEQQIKLLAANIALSSKKQGMDCIYMTGSEYENIDAAVLERLKKELIVQNVKIEQGENIFYDADSLKKGTEIGNIFFVEQTGKSIYDEISNELNLAIEQKICILGVVVLV